MSRVEQLRHENDSLRERIALFKENQASGHLQAEITKFMDESKKNLNEMNTRIADENTKQNEALHALTGNYEGILKTQIELLTENKALSEKKEAQDNIFNENVEKLTKEYEGQIKQFEVKVKANVKKINEFQGGNVINRLIKNDRFRAAMQEKGVSLEGLEKQSRLEDISAEVSDIEGEIQEAEDKSNKLDEELSKMHELIDTMKSLLENMMKEKDNILKQNVVLKQKLKQSEELIGRLLGGVPEGNAEEEEDEEDQEEGAAEEEAAEGNNN